MEVQSDQNPPTMTDSHIALAVLFDVPDGQDSSAHKAKFYAKSRNGTKELLYYGFASNGNKIVCREGYKTATGFLSHVAEVKDDLEALIKLVGKERVLVRMNISMIGAGKYFEDCYEWPCL